MHKIVSLVLIGIATSGFLFGGPAVPEIDPGAGASALTLLAGAMLLIRQKKKF